MTLVHGGEDPPGGAPRDVRLLEQRVRTSSYWIEGDQGVVVIAPQSLLSAAEEVIAHAERIDALT